jgi:uncharacterized membrane protein YebE (DUF533 family)
MQNIIMIVLAALAAVLYVSPDTLLRNADNDLVNKVRENSQLVAIACAAGAGYMYYQSTQRKATSAPAMTATSSAPASDLPTYEQSVGSSQQ